MATDNRQFTLRLQDDNFEKIKVIASRSKRSIAMQIEFIVEQFIEEYERQNDEIHIDNPERT